MHRSISPGFLEGLDLEVAFKNHRLGRTGVGWEFVPVPFPPFLVPIPISVPVVAEGPHPREEPPLLVFLRIAPRAEGFTF